MDAFLKLQDILAGSTQEEKYVRYVRNLMGVSTSGPSPARPPAATATPPAAPLPAAGTLWTSSEGEKRKRKRRDEKEDQEEEKKRKRKEKKGREEKKRKKRKVSSSSSLSSSSSSDTEERERRKRRKRKEKKRKEARKERESKKRRKGKKKREQTPSSSDSSASSSGEERKQKPKLHLTKDRSPQPRDKRTTQYFIRTACKLYFPEWAEWNELKKDKELLRTFQRDVRRNWSNGDSLSEGYIFRQAQRIMKDHRYQLKSKVKAAWDKKEKGYKKPENMDEKVYKEIVQSLAALPGTPSALRAHQGDAGAYSDKRKLVSNVWG